MTNPKLMSEVFPEQRGIDRLDFYHMRAKTGIGLRGMMKHCPNACEMEMAEWLSSNGYQIETPENKCCVCDRPQTWFRLELQNGMCRKCERITNDLAETHTR